MFAEWRLKDFDVGAGIKVGAHGLTQSGDGWIPVDVPGDVHTALIAAGRLDDPFYDQNELKARWVEDREWWYRTTFHADAAQAGERLRLIFHGLDTFARVFLNGAEAGTSSNMFVPLNLDVTDALLDGDNVIAICFTPTAVALADVTGPNWPAIETIGSTKRNLVRKAQFGWGWDWGPRLPTVGLWRPVELKREKCASLGEVHVATVALGGDKARLRFTVDVNEIAGDAKGDVTITLTDADGRVALSETFPGPRKIDATRELASPRLWWTHDLGAPHLYTLNVTLSEAGKTLDERVMKVGIRTIELVRSADKDEEGTEFFRFILNGFSIFAKGACWIPADSFVGSLKADRYRMLLDAAVDTNMNMIRIWGGGIYEHEAFYDICDENGLLVWQDFMFACAPYPEDKPAFNESVRAEVRYQVKRLRHHASLALWCGNNENQIIGNMMNQIGGRNDPLLGDLFYEKMMPEIVKELDPTTPYWPGSPYGGVHPNAQEAGDVHNWTVWHGFPQVVNGKSVGGINRTPEGVAYTRYAEDMSRFISEYGIQASPVLETLKRNVVPSELSYKSPSMEHRIKDVPKHKVDLMMTTVTGIPETLGEYVDFTMQTQAEGLKFGIEHFRRRTPHCSGSLIWQLNDCWPGVSWSIIDYYGFGKAGYYAVRRAYAPVLASFKEVEGGVELWVTNDTMSPIEDRAQVTLGEFAGGELSREMVSYRIGANESRAVWSGKIEGSASRYLRVSSEGNTFADNRMFFAAIKDLKRPKGEQPKVKIAQVSPHELRVDVSADAYLYFVHLIVPHESTHFSDNYFDLTGGETRVITVKNEARALTPADVTVAVG